MRLLRPYVATVAHKLLTAQLIAGNMSPNQNAGEQRLKQTC
jgi:hypothetical protein